MSPRVRNAQAHLLKDDSPEVMRELSRVKGSGEHVSLYGRRASRPVVTPNGRDKWKKEHAEISKALALLERQTRLAKGEEHEQYDDGTAQSDLLKESYCPRKCELIDFYVRWINVSTNRSTTTDEYFFFDFSECAQHKSSLMPGILPSFLRAHYIALIHKAQCGNTSFVRHLLGLEHLFILGLPRTIRTGGISDVQLRRLAGNSMSVQVLEGLFTMLIGVIDVDKPLMAKPKTINDEDIISVELGIHATTPVLARMKFDFPGLAQRNTNLLTSILSPWDLRRALPSDFTPILVDGKHDGECVQSLYKQSVEFLRQMQNRQKDSSEKRNVRRGGVCVVFRSSHRVQHWHRLVG